MFFFVKVGDMMLEVCMSLCESCFICISYNDLTNWGLLMPYGNIKLDQNQWRQYLVYLTTSPTSTEIDFTGGNRTMVAAATIVSMAAAKKAQQNVFALYHS